MDCEYPRLVDRTEKVNEQIVELGAPLAPGMPFWNLHIHQIVALVFQYRSHRTCVKVPGITGAQENAERQPVCGFVALIDRLIADKGRRLHRNQVEDIRVSPTTMSGIHASVGNTQYGTPVGRWAGLVCAVYQRNEFFRKKRCIGRVAQEFAFAAVVAGLGISGVNKDRENRLDSPVSDEGVE